MYLTPLPKDTLVIRYGRFCRQKARITALPGRERSLTLSSAVWIEYTNVTDWRTDRRTDRHRLTAKTALTH